MALLIYNMVLTLNGFNLAVSLLSCLVCLSVWYLRRTPLALLHTLSSVFALGV